MGSLRRTGVGVGASGESPLLELLLGLPLELELELLSELELLLLGASPGISGAASMGNGCAAEAEGFGASAAGAAGALLSPGNGNCCVGAGAADGFCTEGAAVQGLAAGWSAGHGVVVVWARQAAAEKAVAANKSRIEELAGII
ncbi:MAG: hypothetical protein ABI177_12425 [Edaphobacter sp.]